MNVGLKTLLAISVLTCGSSTAWAECYGYDDLGRLISVGYDNTENAEMQYVLDDHGNRKVVETTVSGGVDCSSANGATDTGDDEAVNSSTYDIEQSESSDPTVIVSPSLGNSPPILDDKNLTLVVDQVQSVAPMEGATDPDGDDVSLVGFENNSSLVTVVSSGTPTEPGELLYVKAGFVTGSGFFEFSASDGRGATSIGRVNFTITDPNSGSGAPNSGSGIDIPTCDTDDLTQCQ